MPDNTTRPNDCASPANPRLHDHAGLTKREYFAAMAMQGLLFQGWDGPAFNSAHDLGHAAVLYADALIDELNNAD